MRKLIVTAAIAALLATATPARASILSPTDTLDLYKTCASKVEWHVVACIAYLSGVVDSADAFAMIRNDHKMFCMKEQNVTGRQLREFFLDYLDRAGIEAPVHPVLAALKSFDRLVCDK